MVKKVKTGDYIEVLEGAGNSGVEDGEQGFVTDGDYWGFLEVLFPASDKPMWRGETELALGYGWLTSNKEVKLVCRLSS